MEESTIEDCVINLPPNVFIPKDRKKPAMIIMDFTTIQQRKDPYFKDVMDELKRLFRFRFGPQKP